MGVLGSHGDGNSLVFFYEDDGTFERCGAVIAIRSPGLAFRRISWRERLRSLLRPAPPPPGRWPTPQLPAGWNSGSDVGGPHELLYSSESRRVRVLGHELPLPEDGRTLAVLLDETDGSAPVLRTHPIDLPPVAATSLVDLSSPDRARRLKAWEAQRERNERWLAVVRGDPEIAALLAARD